MKQALEDNPAIYEHVPDIAERLGLMTEDDKAALEDPLGNGTLIFLSFSLGEREILDVFERNAGKDDVRLIFRGFPKGVSFADGIKDIQRLASQFDPMPKSSLIRHSSRTSM